MKRELSHVDHSLAPIRTTSGFAILDAVLAMAIFAIGLLSLNLLYHTVIKDDSSAYIMTDAVELAGSYLDRVQAAPYSAIPSVSSLQGVRIYTVNTSMTPCASNSSCVNDTTDITLVVTKPDGKSYRFSTVKAKLKGMP